MIGWPEKLLGSVVRFCGGGTPSKSNNEYWNGHIPWVSPKDMWVDEVTSSADMITDAAVLESATSIIPQGSVLCVVRSGILARRFPVAITCRDVTINQDLKALIPSKALHPRYLFYFMRAAETTVLDSVTTGATVHRVSTDFLKGLKIAVPPLEEQQRIVAVLDDAFTAIATATVNAEKNLVNARELFSGELRELFSSSDATWQWKAVGEVADARLGKMLDKRKNKGVLKVYLRNINVRWFGFDFSDLLEMRFEDSEASKYTAIKGDC